MEAWVAANALCEQTNAQLQARAQTGRAPIDVLRQEILLYEFATKSPKRPEATDMTLNADDEQQAARARNFRELHRSGCFVLPNAWNGGSAKLLAAAGLPAIGTTSAGLAYSLGRKDAVSEIGLEDCLGNIREIASAVPLPVSADFENAYAHEPDEVAANLRRCIEAGAIGCTIEDWSGDPARGFYDASFATDRIRASVEAAEASGISFTVTARSEAKLHGRAEPLKEAIERLNRFAEVGAHCLYAPGFTDRSDLETLIAEVDGPINVLVGIAGMGASLDEMRDLGARRISVGGSLMRRAMSAAVDAAAEMAEGRFTFADDAKSGGFFEDVYG